MGTKFEDYVRSVEERNDPEQQALLDAFRVQYRRANQLLELRQARGLTQTELARRSGVAQSEISRLEQGSGNPTERTLAALAAELDAEYRLEPTDGGVTAASSS